MASLTLRKAAAHRRGDRHAAVFVAPDRSFVITGTVTNLTDGMITG